MDLLQTVRKEGSRGGVNFSWDDVRNNPRRETYLGHSLMAPVGRWQKNKDLNWYAKAEEAELSAVERAERERERKREELRKIKEAEEDAMKRAMGLPVPDRTNANLEPLGVSQVDVNKALKEALADGEDDEEGGEKGIGFGKKTGVVRDGRDVVKGSRGHDDRRRERSRSRERRRDHIGERGEGKRHRSRSRSEDRDRERRRRHRHRDRSRSRSRDGRHRRSRSRRGEDSHRNRRRDHEERPRSRDRDRHERRRSQDREYRRNRNRSRSPHGESHRRKDD